MPRSWRNSGRPGKISSLRFLQTMHISMMNSAPVQLFRAFLRLGTTAFGGPATVAYIRELAVHKKAWLNEESFRRGVAVAQAIPGATAMQAAAYVGLRTAGPAGALAAFLGFGFPTFVFMTALSIAYARVHDISAVVSAFRGLHLIVVALAANAAVRFGRSGIRNRQDVLLGLAAAAFMVLGGSPIAAILFCALAGALLFRSPEGRPNPEPRAGSRNPGRNPLSTPALLLGLSAAALALLFFTDRKLFDLAAVMLKVDLFAFGGGYASVPLMLNQVVSVHHWLDGPTFMDGIALGQVTPGPIVITATFVGYLLHGLPGAVVGTVSVFTPSFIILTLVVPYFDRMQSNPFVRGALHGALISFVGLLAAVTVRFATAVSWTVPAALLCAAAFIALWKKIDILWVVLVGGAAAMLLF